MRKSLFSLREVIDGGMYSIIYLYIYICKSISIYSIYYIVSLPPTLIYFTLISLRKVSKWKVISGVSTLT